MIIKDYELQYLLFFRLTLLASLFATLWPSISYFIVLQQNGRVHATLEILQWSAGALTTIICLAVLRLSTITLFLSPLASGLVSFFICLIYIRNYIAPQINSKWLSEIFKVGMQSIAWNLSETLTNISDRYFIHKWMNLSQLGIYSHSLSYKDMFNMGTKAFNKTLSPYALETFSNNSDTKSLEQKIKKYYGLLGIGGLFVTLFSYEIVNILTHGKFMGAAVLIPIWFLLLVSFNFGFSYTQFLFVHKKNAFMTYSGVLINIIFVGVTIYSVFKFGIIGASVSIVLSNFSIQLSRRIYARKLGCEKIGEKDFVVLLILLIAMYLFISFYHIDIMGKILIYIVFSGLIAYYYGLHKIIKSNGQKIIDNIFMRAN